MNILIVDDNIKGLENVARFIRKLGHSVDECESALKAFELFKERNYELVFIDIKMPQMSGVDFLKAMLEFPSDTKVVLVTAYAELETAIAAVRYNAFDYLLKPISIDKLVDVIERVSAFFAKMEKNRSINILLYSKQIFLAVGICSTLRAEEDINKINYVTTYSHCIQQTKNVRYDIILIDVDSVRTEELTSIHLKYPDKKVIALISQNKEKADNPQGIPIIYLEDCNRHDLLNRLNSILDGQLTNNESAFSHLKTVEPNMKMNYREKEILLRVAQGKTNKEIAQELYLSPTTIRNYVSKILQKLNIQNRTVAALYVSKYMLEKE
ncbi:MAG: hypothetical protein VR72_14245 [Clostridiaceae bacterium BRH_c20a]|nr:MAG: hypothetical protein VR72_14245 [Clostridiaceae bacterium BRH_c20a]